MCLPKIVQDRESLFDLLTTHSLVLFVVNFQVSDCIGTRDVLDPLSDNVPLICDTRATGHYSNESNVADFIQVRYDPANTNRKGKPTGHVVKVSFDVMNNGITHHPKLFRFEPTASPTPNQGTRSLFLVREYAIDFFLVSLLLMFILKYYVQ